MIKQKCKHNWSELMDPFGFYLDVYWCDLCGCIKKPSGQSWLYKRPSNKAIATYACECPQGSLCKFFTKDEKCLYGEI